METDKRESGIAAVLSFFFNGLGQLYNGHIVKGLLVMLGSTFGIVVLILGSLLIALWLLGKEFMDNQMAVGSSLFVLGLAVMCVFGVYSIVDAYRVGSRK